jgi:hypothetical protein
MNKVTGKFAGQALSAFMGALGDAAASKAVDYFTKAGDFSDAPGVQGKVAGVSPEMAGSVAKYGAPVAAAAAGAALLAGGSALVNGVEQGEKPRSDYALPIGGPMDQLYMRQEGTAASIDQKLAADLMRTEAHAQLADRKFRHQMALQQHRQDAMVPRNQPMEGGVDVSRMLNGYASSLFGSTPRY